MVLRPGLPYRKMLPQKASLPLMRNLFCSALAFIICLTVNSQSIWKHGRLKPTADGHYLQFEDGLPFFWLGDTGWELFHRLTKEEINIYLENRRAKGFNV